jgi:hypothetical protein
MQSSEGGLTGRLARALDEVRMGSHPSYPVYPTLTYPSSDGLSGLSCRLPTCFCALRPVCLAQVYSRCLGQLLVQDPLDHLRIIFLSSFIYCFKE